MDWDNFINIFTLYGKEKRKRQEEAKYTKFVLGLGAMMLYQALDDLDNFPL